MGFGLEHAALAVFTTLAPMGAGAFIVLAYAFIAEKPDEMSAKRLDRLTALPLVVLAAGFAGAFFHLANPTNAFAVFSGVGSSPLSNEILVGVLFAVAAFIYWILALTGKLSRNGRTVCLAVLSVLALVFAVFCGLAYMIPTIPTWNTPLSFVQTVGYLLAGGAILGFCTIGFARIDLPKKAGTTAMTLVLIGMLISIVGLGMQAAGLGNIHNIWGSASVMLPAFGLASGVFVVCGLIAAVLVYIASKKIFSPTLMTVACAVIAIGIFVARIGFYSLYMGIAL